MSTPRFIRRPDVVAKTGLSKSAIFNLEKAGDFPQHFLLTPRCAVWDEAEIEGWLSGRRAAPAVAAAAPDQAKRKTFPGRGKSNPKPTEAKVKARPPEPQPVAPSDPFLTRNQLLAVLSGVARNILHEWEASGKLPPPISLNGRPVGWQRSTIEELLGGRPGQVADPFMDETAACEFFGGVDPETLDALIVSGSVPPPIKVGNQWGWRLSALTAAVELAAKRRNARRNDRWAKR